MSAKVEWVVQDQLIEWTLDSENTEEGLKVVNGIVIDMLDKTPSDQIIMLLDMTQFDVRKSIMNSSRLQGAITFHNHPKWHLTVLYGAQNRAATMIVQMFARVFNASVRFTETREEAYDAAREANDALPPYSEVVG